uniref:Uncharacterized protein n=1 Tax=Dicentrarchus labrax TaxID=13489 RepID=A0A8P4GS94_DICLA
QHRVHNTESNTDPTQSPPHRVHNTESTTQSPPHRSTFTHRQTLSLSVCLSVCLSGSVRDGCCPVGWAQYESDCYYFSTTNFVTRHTNSQLFWIGLSNWRSRQWEWVNGNQYRMDRRYEL